MPLTGQQFNALQQALLSAFPSRAALRQMMRIQMDTVLENVADGSNDSEVVFNLLTWAESQGRLEELITAARTQNPGNPQLKAFAAQVLGPEPAPAADLAQWVTIRDSGPEGTNAAVAVITAMETAAATQGTRLSLSARYLYQKAKQHDEMGSPADDSAALQGTFLEAVMYVAEQFGVLPESDWPYSVGAPDLPTGKIWAKLEARPKHHARFYRLSSYEEIAAQLLQKRPIVAGLPIYDFWLSGDPARTGDIPLPPAGESFIGASAITITGIDPRARTLSFANIWGIGWGKQGFGQMSEEVARTYLFDPAAGDKLWAVGSVR